MGSIVGGLIVVTGFVWDRTKILPAGVNLCKCRSGAGRAFSFSGLGYIGPVFPAKAGIHITAAYGNFPMARLYGFPPARE